MNQEQNSQTPKKGPIQKAFTPVTATLDFIDRYLKALIFLLILFFIFASLPKEAVMPANLMEIKLKGAILDSHYILKKIEEAQNDPKIKGVLFFIDSPGGAVAPSIEISQAIKRLNEKKPVITYAAGTLASGAYYASIWSKKIYANPGSIVGSIGVIFESANLKKLLDKVGVEPQVVKAGKYKEVGTPFRPWKPYEKAELEKVIKDTYDMFLHDVCQARKLDCKNAHQFADAHIFTARQAKAVGLIDEVATIDKAKDTLTWFLHEPSITVDTFNILFSYKGDTLDYVYMPVKPKEKKLPARKRKKEETKVHYLGLTSNMNDKAIPGSRFYIKFNQPVEYINFDSVLFVKDEDSIWAPEFTFTDSLNMKIDLPYKSEPGVHYVLSLPDSCIMDWNGYYNTAKTFDFHSKELKSYGFFALNLKPEKESHYIVQMLNKKERVLKEHYFVKDTSIQYKYLKPGDYLFKIIFDKNNNKKWDTGDYLKKIEPEFVTYYKDLLNIRANWEIEQDWSFDSNEHIPPPLNRKPLKN